MSGWYLWFSIILTSLDFPFIIPLGDLSKRFPSMTEMKKRKMERRGKQHNDNINGAGEHQENDHKQYLLSLDNQLTGTNGMLTDEHLWCTD